MLMADKFTPQGLHFSKDYLERVIVIVRRKTGY